MVLPLLVFFSLWHITCQIFLFVTKDFAGIHKINIRREYSSNVRIIQVSTEFEHLHVLTYPIIGDALLVIIVNNRL